MLNKKNEVIFDHCTQVKMTDTFLHIFYKQLSLAFANKYSVNEEDVWSIIDKCTTEGKKPEGKNPEGKKPEDEKTPELPQFHPFGRFTTKDRLDKGVQAAMKKNKFCNVSTGKMHDDTKHMRSEYDLYSSRISGVHNSRELLEALRWYPGKLLNTLESNFVNDVGTKEPAFTSPPQKAHHITLSKPPKLILIKHPKTKVLLVKDGMYAYDETNKQVYGVVDKQKGTVRELNDDDIIDLENRELKYRLKEEDEGPQDGISESTHDGTNEGTIDDVKNAIKKL